MRGTRVTANLPVLGSSLTGFIRQITPVSRTPSYYREQRRPEGRGEVRAATSVWRERD